MSQRLNDCRVFDQHDIIVALRRTLRAYRPDVADGEIVFFVNDDGKLHAYVAPRSAEAAA